MTEAELASYPIDDPHSTVDWSQGGTVLAFVNEVAGGRRLLEALRERAEASGAVMDPEPSLALDDAVRAFEPHEILLSSLYEARFGLLRRDLVEWAKDRFDVPVTHIPVRVDDDSVRWDVTHTLVVGTQTIASPDLIARFRENGASPWYTTPEGLADFRATNEASFAPLIRASGARRCPCRGSSGRSS